MAKSIAALNWSYQKNYTDILGINEEDEFDIVKCTNCGFLYSRLLPSDQFLAALYDAVINLDSDIATSHSWQESARRCRYISTLVKLLGEYDPATPLLDYGAGYGQTAQILNSVGNSVIAYETSKDRINTLDDGAIIFVRSHDEIRAHAPYAAIICDNVLEHVPDPRLVSSLFCKILRPGGILFVSVPAYEPGQVQTAKSNPDKSLNPWEHLNYFNLKHLDAILSDYGFAALKRNELGENVDIGLRAEAGMPVRLKNSIASVFRMVLYIMTGSSNESVNCRYYRLCGSI